MELPVSNSVKECRMPDAMMQSRSTGKFVKLL
jgi:hypothetical protein